MTPYYQDDLVTLYHGDCREVTDWLAADVLVTDPPYGVGYGARRGGSGRLSRGAVREGIAGDGDFSVAEAAFGLWGAKPMAAFANHASLLRTLTAVSGRLSRVRVATWHKTNAGGTPGNPWLADIEFAVCGVPTWPGFIRSGLISGRRFTGNPAWNSNPDAYLHPTQKPVPVMELLIDLMPAGVVADPFAGSGSTLVAAKLQGRRAIGVELEERYCAVAARRLTQDSLPFGEASRSRPQCAVHPEGGPA